MEAGSACSRPLRRISINVLERLRSGRRGLPNGKSALSPRSGCRSKSRKPAGAVARSGLEHPEPVDARWSPRAPPTIRPRKLGRPREARATRATRRRSVRPRAWSLLTKLGRASAESALLKASFFTHHAVAGGAAHAKRQRGRSITWEIPDLLGTDT